MANIYKRQKEGYERAHKRKKDIMWKVITVTAVALALSLLAAVISGGAYMLKGLVDTEPPVIQPVSKKTEIAFGESIEFRNLVTVTDNSGKSCELDFDESGVDISKSGTYKVVYTATDPSGNESTYTLTIRIKATVADDDELMVLVEKVAKQYLKYTKDDADKNNYSKEKIVRDIYNFVNDPSEANKDNANIVFNDGRSNCENQYRQNGYSKREGWKTDWREEALLTLKMSRMSGDCYTFYAVSKAFFEYFDIENVGIQRTTESPMTKNTDAKTPNKANDGGTHYWNIVNIGTDSEPRWYYYDATRYAGHFKSAKNSCLLTESQLLSYVTGGGVSNSGYYWIEKSNTEFFDADDNNGKYPTVETEKLG